MPSLCPALHHSHLSSFSTLAFHHQHWDIRIPVASEPVNTAGLVTGQVRELSRKHQFSLPISWISSINVTLQLDFARGRYSFFFLGVRLRFRKLRLAARPHSAKTSTCTTSKEKIPSPHNAIGTSDRSSTRRWMVAPCRITGLCRKQHASARRSSEFWHDIAVPPLPLARDTMLKSFENII